jgi:hypothetical protein
MCINNKRNLMVLAVVLVTLLQLRHAYAQASSASKSATTVTAPAETPIKLKSTIAVGMEEAKNSTSSTATPALTPTPTPTAAVVRPPSKSLASQASQAISSSGKSRPEVYLAEQEQFAVETQRYANMLGNINMQEQVEQRMKALRLAKGEDVAVNSLPTCVGISGIDGRLVARLVYPDKTTAIVRIGDALRSDHIVQMVSPNRVVIRKGNEDFQLPLVFIKSDQAPSQATMQRSGAIPFDSAGAIVGRQSPAPSAVLAR